METNTNINKHKVFMSKVDRITNLKSRVLKGKASTKEKLYKEKKAPSVGQNKKNSNNAAKQNEKNLASLDKKFQKQIGDVTKKADARIDDLVQQNKALSKSLHSGLKDTGESFSNLTDRVQEILRNKNSTTKNKSLNTGEAGEVDPDKAVLPYIKQPDKEVQAEEEVKDETKKAKAEVTTTKNGEGYTVGGFVFGKSTEIDTVKQGEENKKIDFKINSVIPVGDYKYRVTNVFGERTGSNAVLNRKGHSKGVDMVSTIGGKASNIPVVIADGVVIKVALEGSGKSITTAEGKAAGYMVYVQLREDPSKVVGYWHLGKSVHDNGEALLGMNVYRGDVLVNDPSWTGSGTGAHVKIVMSDYDAKSSKITSNYSENDPTNVILTGKIGG